MPTARNYVLAQYLVQFVGQGLAPAVMLAQIKKSRTNIVGEGLCALPFFVQTKKFAQTYASLVKGGGKIFDFDGGIHLIFRKSNICTQIKNYKN